MPLIEARQKAPAFRLKDQFDKHHNLKDYLGRIVVLYFYPKDGSTSCTKQACQFRDYFPNFTKIKAVILGVSPHDLAAHQRFVAEHQLPFTLLSDLPDGRGKPSVSEVYGAWQPRAMYGRPYMGIVRTTYLIDQGGRVVRRWDRVNVTGHVSEVLEAVKLLHSGEILIDPDDRPVPLPRRRKHRQKTRTRDTDPQYTPIRGGGNRSSRGPQARKARLPVAKARTARPVALVQSNKR
jgi:peroxiredoxin Q/BCP